MINYSRLPPICSQICPQLVTYLGPYDIFNCRLVCKEWSRAIDKLTWDVTFVSPMEKTPATKEIYWACEDALSKSCFDFDNDADMLREFYNTFSKTHANTGRSPFPLHFMSIQQFAGDVDPNNEIWKATGDILRAFGMHLTCFDFFIPKEDDGALISYYKYVHLLSKCLQMLPNLTELNISGDISNDAKSSRSHLQVLRSNSEFRLFQNLKILNMSRLEESSFRIQRRLVSSHAYQLTQLSLRITRSTRSIKIPPEMPCLKELYVKTECIKNADTFLSQLQFSRYPPQLARLGLFLCNVKLKKGSLNQIFNTFNYFGSTLQAMVIRSEGQEDNENLPPEYFDVTVDLNCPFMEKVEIFMFSHLSLNFIRNFTGTLKKLNINISDESQPRTLSYPGELLNCYEYLAGMAKSTLKLKKKVSPCIRKQNEKILELSVFDIVCK